MKKKPTLEDAMEELAQLVKRLEDDQLPLEKALDLFEQGIKLSKHCHKCLEEAEKKIKILTEDDSGEPLLTDWTNE